MTAKEEFLPYKQIVLSKVRLNAIVAVSRHMLLDARLTEMDDFIANAFRLQLDGFLWGKTIERHEVSYPADWWQAIKERWMPAWVKSIWPVKMKRIELDLKAIWPTLRMMVPDHQPRLILTSFGSSLGGYDDRT